MGEESGSLRFSRRLKSPLATRKQVEATVTQVLQAFLFDPPVSAALNALLIGPPGNRDRGVQIGDEAGLLRCVDEVISQGGTTIKPVLDMTFSSENVPLGVTARPVGQYEVLCGVPWISSPGDEMVDIS